MNIQLEEWLIGNEKRFKSPELQILQFVVI